MHADLRDTDPAEFPPATILRSNQLLLISADLERRFCYWVLTQLKTDTFNRLQSLFIHVDELQPRPLAVSGNHLDHRCLISLCRLIAPDRLRTDSGMQGTGCL